MSHMDQSIPANKVSLCELGEFLLWLQALAETCEASTFRTTVLDRFRSNVPFSRAMWGDATINEGMTVLNPANIGFDQKDIAPFERAVFAEQLLMQVLHDQGRTIAYALSGDSPPLLQRFGVDWNVAHVMATAQFEPHVAIATGHVFTRSTGDRAWSEEERAFTEAVFPHMLKAWLDCQTRTLLRLVKARSDGMVHAAACQGKVFKFVGPGAAKLFQRQWPEWKGPDIPPELARIAADPDIKEYSGTHIVVRALDEADITLFIARERCLADTLTARERIVAELNVSGLSSREIAMHLNIAPTTAKNHIAAIHRRLGVSRNSEIAKLLLQAQ
jgi:DNA-binding CsgD family transcriptional regulator